MSEVEKKLEARGVFLGAHGLEGFANASEFWDKQPYGKRLYYGDGNFDYLHLDVLNAAIAELASSPSETGTPQLPSASEFVGIVGDLAAEGCEAPARATPRTDAVEVTAYINGINKWTPAIFARTLERELAESRLNEAYAWMAQSHAATELSAATERLNAPVPEVEGQVVVHYPAGEPEEFVPATVARQLYKRVAKVQEDDLAFHAACSRIGFRSGGGVEVINILDAALTSAKTIVNSLNKDLKAEKARAEAATQALAEAVESGPKVIKACPYCPDQGWYEQGGEQVQCQFCYETPDSVFNFSAAAIRQGTEGGRNG